VPGKTLGDRALELERSTALLEERLENLRQQSNRVPEIEVRITAIDERVEALRRDLGRLDTNFVEVIGRIQETEKQQHASAEKKLEELRSRRWDLFKLFLAALLGSALTLASSVVSKVVERMSESRLSPTRK